MKSNYKIKYIILLCVCLNCIGVCLYLNFLYQTKMQDDGDSLESLRDSIKQYESIMLDANTTAPAPTTEDAGATPDTEPDPFITVDTTEADSVETTVRPQVYKPSATLNFDKLWAVNPEIHAWIDIEGTKIDYPILQSKNNDRKYLNTAYDDSPYIGGAIFTQATYNNTDFNDPVTLIYGHTMRSGTMFGQLQKSYSSVQSFEENSDIVIYLPGEVRHYTVFAAVPYDAMHILHTYDFSNTYWYNRFFDDVGRIREIGANFDREAFPEAGDRVIILSVCLNEDTARRYLVMAAFEEDLADNARDSKN